MQVNEEEFLSALPTPEQEREIWDQMEKEFPDLWRRCYPRIYQPYKSNEYASPKVVSRQMFVIASKVNMDRIGQSEQYEIFWASQMAKYRTPIYWVSRDILQMVMHTTPPYKQWDWYNMPLPMPAAAFLIPKGELVHPTEGNCLMLAYSRHKVREDIPSLATENGPKIWSSLNGSMIHFSLTERGYLTHYNIPYDYFPEADLTKLNELIAKYDQNEHSSAWVGRGGYVPKMTKDDTVFGAVAAHFLFGITLLMMRKPELVRVAKLESKVKGKHGTADREFWSPNVIGEHYKIKRVSDGAGKGGTHASPRGHWVSGSWKGQHYGPGNSQYKEVLIEPYFRGVD